MGTKTTYNKRWISVQAKYVCACGNTFYRKNRDWYTMNPFNRNTEKETINIITKELQNKIRCCPKCQSNVTPEKSKH